MLKKAQTYIQMELLENQRKALQVEIIKQKIEH